MGFYSLQLCALFVYWSDIGFELSVPILLWYNKGLFTTAVHYATHHFRMCVQTTVKSKVWQNQGPQTTVEDRATDAIFCHLNIVVIQWCCSALNYVTDQRIWSADTYVLAWYTNKYIIYMANWWNFLFCRENYALFDSQHLNLQQ